MNHDNNQSLRDRSIRSVAVQRISVAGDGPEDQSCQVAVEEALTVAIEDVGNFTIMCSPCDAEALVAGFIFAEGMIDDIDDIISISALHDQTCTIAARLDNPTRLISSRNLIVSTSCGLCGTRNIDNVLASLEPMGDSLRVDAETLVQLTETMQSRQGIFASTGGTHAAGIFDAGGNIITLGEDVGRHNALDKAIGKCLLARHSTKGCGAVLSGRISFELVTKAARAGIELMAAVSAPTSLAIDVAEKCNITLCCFVRPGRASVFTHPKRLPELEPAP